MYLRIDGYMLVEELKGIFSMPFWGPAERKYITDVNSVQMLLLEHKTSTYHMATMK